MKTSKCMRMGLCATSATLSGVLGVEAKALYFNCISPHARVQESTSNEPDKEQFHVVRDSNRIWIVCSWRKGAWGSLLIWINCCWSNNQSLKNKCDLKQWLGWDETTTLNSLGFTPEHPLQSWPEVRLSLPQSLCGGSPPGHKASGRLLTSEARLFWATQLFPTFWKTSKICYMDTQPYCKSYHLGTTKLWIRILSFLKNFLLWLVNSSSSFVSSIPCCIPICISQ